jgi:hypothetical protein
MISISIDGFFFPVTFLGCSATGRDQSDDLGQLGRHATTNC